MHVKILIHLQYIYIILLRAACGRMLTINMIIAILFP